MLRQRQIACHRRRRRQDTLIHPYLRRRRRRLHRTSTRIIVATKWNMSSRARPRIVAADRQ